MFPCTACLRRAIQNGATDIHPYQISSPHLRGSNRLRQRDHRITTGLTSQRHHATFESLARGHHKRILRKAIQDQRSRNSEEGASALPPPNARRKGPAALTKGEIKDALARHRNRENNRVIKDDMQDEKMQIRMKKEIQAWHTDPIQLANQVQKKLRIPDFVGALNMVRASEGVVGKNVVSWNHLTDFCMAQGDPDNAWKVYNEMKKRGHRPDAHTYTIMLRGLSANARKKGSAERAVSIYNSMFAPNSVVQPNTIHTNAALNVCARTREMDSLWAIAGKMPTRGAGAPDRWTFTTILNAIREDTIAKVAEILRDPNADAIDGMSVTQRQDVFFDEALKDARKLWADVSFRWRRADLIVDETLVCAMGRLILGCGSRNDFKEIFDLVEQTMNVRLKERKANNTSSILPAQIEAPEAELEAEPEAEPEPETATTYVPMSTSDTAMASQAGTSLEQAHPAQGARLSLPLSESIVYAQPSNNTLGMLLEAALGSKDWQLGKSYWHLLTTPNGPYKIKPDPGNVIAYLRLLRVSRSSKTAVDLLSQTWPDEVARTIYRRATFVIAMSTCMRDKNNPSAFETADKLLLLMQEKLEEQSLHMYDAEDAESQLSFKEKKAKRRQALANLDDLTFGEEEAQADLLRSKSSVESLYVDPKALRIYLDLAIVTTGGWSEGLTSRTYIPPEGEKQSTLKFERDIKKNNLLKALRRIDSQLPIISRLAKLKVEEVEMQSIPRPKKIPYGRGGSTTKYQPAEVGERLDDLIDLLRTIVGAYDRVIMMAERFEDENLPRLDERMIRKFSENKRTVAGFLSRTKEGVAKVQAKKYSYAQFRNRADENDNDGDEDWENQNEDEDSSSVSKSKERERERGIARDLRKVYRDTDRSLDRTRSLSRRQRNERRQGVAQRMARRNLGSTDIGILNENLEIENREAVEMRMRQRAFEIRVDPVDTAATSAS